MLLCLKVLLLAFAIFSISSCRESILRPNAIVPWSEYYKRVNAKPNLLELSPRISGDIRRAPQRDPPTDEMLLQQAALAEVMQAVEEDRKYRVSQIATNIAKPKVPYALKPQIRKKLFTEPADFQKLGMVAAKNVKDAEKRPPDYHPPLYPEQYPYMKLNNLPSHPFLTGDSVKQISRYNSELKTRIIPKTSYKSGIDSSNEALPEIDYAKLKPRKDGTRMTTFGQVARNPKGFQKDSNEALDMTPEMLARFAKTMNIPPGLLRNGVADGVGLPQLPARQLAAQSFVDTGNPLGTIGDIAKATPHFTRIAPASQVDITANSLLTNPFLSPNSPTSQFLNQNLGIQQVPLQTNGPNPFETLLSNGNALDQLSKLAKNLLMSEDGGQNNLLTASIKALQRQGSALDENLTAAQSETRSAPSMMERLMASAAQAINKGMKEQERQAKITAIKKEENEKEEKEKEEVDKSLKLLQGVPEEQRKLLEKVIQNGEVDSKTLESAINTLTKDDTEEESKTEKANRLLEWIKKNRPVKTEVVLSADRLPYYGKYCGSFAEQSNSTRKYTGAVWAVDNRRLIVSKFFFQPGALTENITFWAGPKESTLNLVEDMFPSRNGFYLKPVPIDVAIFAVHEAPEIEAKARVKVNASETLFGVTPISPSLVDQQLPKRRKRDTVHVERDEPPPEKADRAVHLVVKGGMVRIENPANGETMQEVVVHSSNNKSFSVNPTSSSTFSAPFRIQQPDEDPTPDPLSAMPLEWYAGFQPLLLTLPSSKFMKTTHWISLWDHKNQKSVTSIVFPNGPAFQVPEITTLRALSPNGLFNVSSGPIRLIDMKTIEVADLKISSGDTPLWFMVGKDILPNANGHILPIFDKTTNTFDCDSLMDYKGQTVTLRLPGTMDMKDVFWFSIFSLTTGLSYSHIYLPYNDMHLPPDLSAIPTPKCTWKS